MTDISSSFLSALNPQEAQAWQALHAYPLSSQFLPFRCLSSPYFITLSVWGWLLHNLLRKDYFFTMLSVSLGGQPWAQQIAPTGASHCLFSPCSYPNQSQLSSVLVWRTTWFGCHPQGWKQPHLAPQSPDNLTPRQKSPSEKVHVEGHGELTGESGCLWVQGGKSKGERDWAVRPGWPGVRVQESRRLREMTLWERMLTFWGRTWRGFDPR